MATRDIYLAAPFFTPGEAAVVDKLEELIQSGLYTRKFFSPRKDGGNKNRQGSVTENAKEIYNANMYAMRTHRECIAWIDREPPEGHDVWLCEKSVDGIRIPVRGPLLQPDIGTVFELGVYAGWRESGFPCFTTAFTLRPRGQTLNVMLLQGVNLIVSGYEELRAYLAYYDPVVATEFHPEWLPKNWSNYGGTAE